MNVLVDITINIFSEFAGALLAIIFAKIVWDTYKEHLYGDWQVHVIVGGKPKIKKFPTTWKTEKILTEESERRVYCKGIASTVGWINTDIENLVRINRQEKIITVNMDDNPPK